MTDEVQRASIERALATLYRDGDAAHSNSLIERIAGKEAALAVTALRDEYRQANKDAKANGGALLSPDAADYWQEAQSVLAYARIALADNDPLHRKEGALSRRCERLLESFDARVPDQEKGKFVQYDPQTLGAQDDRWNWTVDGEFPLLSPQFSDNLPVKNPMGEAQRVVLSALLARADTEVSKANVERLTAMLRQFSDERTAAERKSSAQAAKAGLSSQKQQAKAAKAEKRKALVASGDQKATRSQRNPRVKLEIFETKSGDDA